VFIRHWPNVEHLLGAAFNERTHIIATPL